MPRAEEQVGRGRRGHVRQVEEVERAAAEAGLRRGLTVPEVAQRYRVGEDRVRGWIRSGQLRAINTADAVCGKPRFVCLPEHLDEFEKGRSCGPAPKPVRRKRKAEQKDYFPD